MITDDEKGLIKGYILGREDFKTTLCEDKESEMWEHSYNAVELFGQVVVYCQYMDGCSNESSFYIYDRQTMKTREATETEDEVLRTYDQNSDSFLNLPEIQFIVCRNPDNSIDSFDSAAQDKKKSGLFDQLIKGLQEEIEQAEDELKKIGVTYGQVESKNTAEYLNLDDNDAANANHEAGKIAMLKKILSKEVKE